MGGWVSALIVRWQFFATPLQQVTRIPKQSNKKANLPQISHFQKKDPGTFPRLKPTRPITLLWGQPIQWSHPKWPEVIKTVIKFPRNPTSVPFWCSRGRPSWPKWQICSYFHLLPERCRTHIKGKSKGRSRCTVWRPPSQPKKYWKDSVTWRTPLLDRFWHRF